MHRSTVLRCLYASRSKAGGLTAELGRQHREGMEDQLGALGLALNAVVLWNSLYLDRAAKQLAADGFPVTDDLLARLSPLQFEHINFRGRYAFFRPQEPACAYCA